MTGSPITHVSDTARWVAIYRARESERPDAIFRDPFARRLAGPEGEAMVRQMEKRLRGDWPMIVRTAVMDEIILRLIPQGIDTVLNLACGLDTRAWRLGLPPGLRWIDVDMPGILDHKLSMLEGERPTCTYEAVRMDLSDEAARRTLFDRVGAASQSALVITEGLLIYLGDTAVRSLAQDLHAVPAFRWWLSDLASPDLLRMMGRTWGKDMGPAPFRFAPAEGTAWFASTGWIEAEFRSTFYESLRLDRTFPLARFWNFVSRFTGRARREKMRHFSGIVLFQRRP
jgi:methyltransferase (TIGR00027 family)